ncbi:MAG: hotdog domain-containing protein [Vicinamibacterales bacterium]
MSTLTLPLDHAAITRILPHRYPFLLVDRITEFEPDARIVGLKNVTAGERFLSPPDSRGRRTLPPTVLTEAVAQVGGILILAKPENVGHLIYFRGIEQARFRGAATLGDTIVIEARVVRLRGRMGVLTGHARVGDRMLLQGTMTFALGPRADGSPGIDA